MRLLTCASRFSTVQPLFSAAMAAGMLMAGSVWAQPSAPNLPPSTSTASAASPAAPTLQASPAPSPASTAAPATETASLPEEYAPSDQPPRFNSNQPPFIRDTEELLKLKSQGPPWVQQVLSFPPENELARHLGRDSGGSRERAAEAIRQIVHPKMLPPAFPEHLIPLSRWAVLYDDWRRQGGTDVFLTKYELNGFTVLLLESHNHVTALIRDLSGSRAGEFSEVQERVSRYADVLFTEGLKPLSAKDLQIFRTSMSPLYMYGWYVPRIEALTGGSVSARDLMTTGGQVNEESTAAGASAVRFFSNGDFAAFMALKPIAVGELKNPFESRFAMVNPMYPGGEVPFWERDSMAGRERKKPAAVPGGESDQDAKQRQIEEYLGSFLYDQEGRKLSEWVPIKDLERAFIELSREQQLAIVERRMVDEYLTAGMRALAAGNHNEALQAWTRLLQLDPENPRAAILLQLAVKERAKQDFEGNTEKARRDPVVNEAMDAIARQQTTLALKRDQQSLEEARDRAIRDYRTRGLSFLSEANYTDSLREWDKILKVDPGNPTALLFKDICETRLKEQDAADRPAPPGGPMTAPRRVN